jgi:hypothetical protein
MSDETPDLSSQPVESAINRAAGGRPVAPPV